MLYAMLAPVSVIASHLSKDQGYSNARQAVGSLDSYPVARAPHGWFLATLRYSQWRLCCGVSESNDPTIILGLLLVGPICPVNHRLEPLLVGPNDFLSHFSRFNTQFGPNTLSKVPPNH